MNAPIEGGTPGGTPSVSPAAPGASVAFTSTDPVIVQARGLMNEGQFTRAEELIRGRGKDHDPAGDELLEIISRVRIAYDLDEAAMLAKLRAAIPDVTADDLLRWRNARQVQYRVIDGQVRYFGREPANIFRFCDEAKRRRRDTSPDNPAWKLEDHLARVIAAAERDGRAEVVPIRHRVRYTLTIPPDAPSVKPGAVVRVWLPFPHEYGKRQYGVKLVGTSPAYKVLAPESAPQRTVYFEERVPAGNPKPLVFEETFEFVSSAYCPNLDPARAKPGATGMKREFVEERPPHIVFTPRVKQIVSEVVGDESNPLIRAQKLFRYVTDNVAYCAEEEYSTIPSLSDHCLSTRRGDCGVQTMLFITLCRAAGIPARWQSGWETKRVGFDMHDWCEIYIEPWGWLPCDPSYGPRPGDDPRVRDFYFGHQDSYRMIVNFDYGQPLVPAKASFRSEPLDFQRGEVEIDGHNLYYPHWDYDFTPEWLDEGP